MTSRRDDWDGDERDALDGLEPELAEIRRRHQDDPSLATLRAAAGDALPHDLQVKVDRHLQGSAWSRAIVDGLRDAGADDRLDAASEDQLFARIMRDAEVQSAGTSRRRWKPTLMMGGLALAASVLLAVVVSRSFTSAGPESASTPIRTESPQVAQPSSTKPLEIRYVKPDVKLSPAALTWRGNASANPFLEAVAPAFAAYRTGDYEKAVALFDELSKTYPGSIEVLFYQGASRMLAGNDAAAVAPLEAAARLRSATFAADVAWSLAVARVRSGDRDAAATIRSICDGGGAHATEACTATAQLR